ncbi:MAG: heme-binding protein [Dehalococcoidia bacterium]
MKFEEARKLADVALAKAAEMNRPIAVVVVDAFGWVVLAENHHPRESFAAYSAECKAVTAAVIGRDSKDCIGTMERYPFLHAPLYDRLAGRFLAMGGGALLKRGEDIIGGIGVAGSGADTDHEIAVAAAGEYHDPAAYVPPAARGNTA